MATEAYGGVIIAMVQKMVFWTIIFLVFIAVLALCWAIYYFMTYRNRAVIFDAERRLAATVCRFKILYRKGIIKFFKVSPNKMIIPSADCFVPFRRKASFLAVEQNGEFFTPLKVSPNPGFIVDAGNFAALKNFHIQDAKDTELAYAKKQSFWVQMAPFIALMFVGVILLIIAIMMFKDGGSGGGPVDAIKGTVGQVIPGK